MSERPPWQMTLEWTLKGTEEECEAMGDKLRAYARRIGAGEPFVESEPNCDLSYSARSGFTMEDT